MTSLNRIAFTIVALVTVRTVAACVPSSTGGSGCASLSACCAKMNAEDAVACDDIAATGLDSTCSGELMTYQSSGLCGGSPGTSDAGIPPISNTGCTALAACCAKMTGGAQEACDVVAATGTAASCTTELGVYTSNSLCQASGMDGGGPIFGPDSGPVSVPDTGTGPGMGTGPGTGPGTGSCNANEVTCPTGCVDLSNDVSNCGSCGYACPAGPSGTAASCKMGTCAYNCTDPSKTLCDYDPSVNTGYCDDLQTSDYSCGKCDNDCGDSMAVHLCQKPACQAGQCVGVPDIASNNSTCDSTDVDDGTCESGVCMLVLGYCAGTGNATTPYSVSTDPDGEVEEPSTTCTCNGNTMQYDQGSMSCGTCMTGMLNVYPYGQSTSAPVVCFQ